jgi:hypothetical protein
MKRLICLTSLILAVAAAGFAQPARPRALGFASDTQTVPVMANTPGFGGTSFQTYVAILNPTAATFAVNVSLYDAAGVKHDASITLMPGEQKTYTNFLDAVFHYTGGGAVTFQSPESTGGQHNNRFIVEAEIRTAGTAYGTTVPALEFAGSSSRAFSAGITVDSGKRTNVGCFNQSGFANRVKATILDSSGHLTIGSVDLILAPNAWGQTGLGSIVSNGYVQFDPSDSAVCYAVVVDNSTNDGRFIPAVEYTP